ncbi:uncharacterized protein LOC129599685 [Paramacrobiotus metropolitanus]|uniref:uncharacterized protein LOC129599685 n=1 Tax=Paramacrobiotus metropolitanus TaxID=2943436 RepID=UPI002445D02F|nr:uncharacterized protein LOC129599685 [Paramacrobiotus metropolitanus]
MRYTMWHSGLLSKIPTWTDFRVRFDSLEEDRIIQKACTSTKVACDPGWTCQMGVIVFPSSSDHSLDCESFDKDCLQVSENRYSANSMEVYCIREDRPMLTECRNGLGSSSLSPPRMGYAPYGLPP